MHSPFWFCLLAQSVYHNDVTGRLLAIPDPCSSIQWHQHIKCCVLDTVLSPGITERVQRDTSSQRTWHRTGTKAEQARWAAPQHSSHEESTTVPEDVGGLRSRPERRQGWTGVCQVASDKHHGKCSLPPCEGGVIILTATLHRCHNPHFIVKNQEVSRNEKFKVVKGFISQSYRANATSLTPPHSNPLESQALTSLSW